MLAQKEMMDMKNVLLEKKGELMERLEKIRNSKQRKEPLSADSGEQALELENNEVVDALDVIEKNELGQINNSLKRIEEGSYGVCVECGDEISFSRLKALPFASHCISCVESGTKQ
jgi:DnaK suppressor protein